MVVDLIILVFIIVGALVGRARGFASMILSVFSFIIAIVLSMFLYTPVENFLIKNTQIDEKVNQTIYSEIEISNKEEEGQEQQDNNVNDDNAIIDEKNETKGNNDINKER